MPSRMFQKVGPTGSMMPIKFLNDHFKVAIDDKGLCAWSTMRDLLEELKAFDKLGTAGLPGTSFWKHWRRN